MSLTIVKAACKHRFNGWIIEGRRHWDDEMRRQYDQGRGAYYTDHKGRRRFRICEYKGPKHANWVQGFVDSAGNFHDRYRAYEIAEAAGQVSSLTTLAMPKQLYSEMLAL